MNPKKLQELAKLSIDLGKIVFGAAVIGFFVPGFSGDVNILGFVVGTLSSALLFSVGIKLVT